MNPNPADTSAQLVNVSRTELAAPVAPQSLAVKAPPSVGEMLSAVIERGVTSENVAAIEKLVGLYERMEVRNAEKQFAEAFVALQADIPSVQTTKAVPGNDGRIRYHFAPYEEIMATVRPYLLRHGFTVSFSTKFNDGRVTQICTLQHTGGHSRTNEFSVRVGKGPPGSSEAQGDGAAATYAKRFALCAALNIVCEMETERDASVEGAPITADQAIYLREKVRETKSDEKAFLQFAGASKFEEIASSKYDRLLAALNRKAAQ